MRTGCAGDSTRKQADLSETNNKRSNDSHSKNTIYVVGIGPGNPEEMTGRAVKILSESECIVGYKTYIALLPETLLAGKEVVSTGMTGEVERCQEAVRLAKTGKKVSVVSSGDAGIYGMAGLVMEILHAENSLSEISVEVIPGVTAAQAAAAVLGAPLMNDFAVISLSDLLTPLAKILKRAEAAAAGGFVTALYNPKSASRTEHIEKVQEIFLKYRSPQTPVGIVKNALREGQAVLISTLGEFTKEEIDMFSLVIIGNEDTKILGDYLVTVRGYTV